MPSTTRIELVTPENLLLNQDARLVVVPGSEGDFGVLPRHSPLISNIRPGVISVYADGLDSGVTDRYFIAGGYAEVSAEGCVILAEEAYAVSEIDPRKAQARLSSAKKMMQESKSEGEIRVAKRELAIAQALIQASRAKK